MNFNDVLNTKAGDVERPHNIPIGTYRFKVKKVPGTETLSSDKGSWDTLDFQLQLVEAEDDVDQDDLSKAGGLTGLAGTMRLRFMFDKGDEVKFKRTLYNLKRFLFDHLKIEGDDSTPLKEAINNSVGVEGKLFVKWRADPNDKEIQYAEIAKTMPVD